MSTAYSITPREALAMLDTNPAPCECIRATDSIATLIAKVDAWTPRAVIWFCLNIVDEDHPVNHHPEVYMHLQARFRACVDAVPRWPLNS